MVYPTTGQSFVFRSMEYLLGGTWIGGTSCSSDCPLWTTAGRQALGGRGFYLPDWPASDTFTDAAHDPIISTLTVGTSSGDVSVSVSWPAS